MIDYVVEIYRLDIANSEFRRLDIVTTFRNLNYFTKKNGKGSASFSMSVWDPKTTKSNLQRFVNHVAIKRFNTIIWFGPITSISGTVQDVGGDITIEATTYLHHLESRYTEKLEAYKDTDQSTIIGTLISNTQAKTNGTLLITTNLAAASVSRNRTYERETLADALINMSSVPQGLDFDFTPIVDANNQLSGVNFNTYYPMPGTLRTDVPPLELGLNIKTLTFKTTTDMFNNLISEGAGTGEEVIETEVDNSDLQEAYTRREFYNKQSDVSILDTLEDNANALFSKRSTELVTYDITLYGGKKPQYGEFNLNDILRVNINIGVEDSIVNNNLQARVTEIAVELDDNGVETVIPKVTIAN